MSVEFRGGFWEERLVSVNGGVLTTKVYIPDTREVFNNSIEYLHDLLYPYFDKEMMKASEKAEEDINKAYLDKTIIKQPDREDDSSTGTKQEIREFENAIIRMSFRSQKVKINRLLFRELNCFLHRIRYLEGRTFEEDI